MKDHTRRISQYIKEFDRYIGPYLSLTAELGVQHNDDFSLWGNCVKKFVHDHHKPLRYLAPDDVTLTKETISMFKVLLAAQQKMLNEENHFNYRRELKDLYDQNISSFRDVRKRLSKPKNFTTALQRAERVRDDLNHTDHFYPFHICELERFLNKIPFLLDRDFSSQRRGESGGDVELLTSEEWGLYSYTKATLAQLDDEYRIAFEHVRHGIL